MVALGADYEELMRVAMVKNGPVSIVLNSNGMDFYLHGVVGCGGGGGASCEDDAVEVGRSVARNNLFKAAIFGNDPNWGRVLAAIGTTSAEFDPYAVDVTMNGVRVCHAGGPDRPREEVDLSDRIVSVLIELGVGDAARGTPDVVGARGRRADAVLVD